jgi:hypothetical protein
VHPLTASLTVAISLALLPRPAEPQQPRVPPDEVARAVISADSTGDWGTLLRLAHPDALVQFRAIQVFQLGMLGVDREGTDFPGMDSSSHARWTQALARHERFLLDSVFQVPTVDSLAHTSPDTVFARRLRQSFAAATADSAGPAARREPGYRVVGAVKAHDTLAYVVLVRPLKQPLGPIPELFRDYPRETQQTEVMVLRRYDREWRSMLEPLSHSYGQVVPVEQEAAVEHEE